VIRVRVSFYSYFRELTGERGCVAELQAGTSIAEAYALLAGRFPRLGPMRNSTLVAVGVEYQTKDYVLKDGDELALFPPVQGG
jgi:molybdopterin converting factor small subunit